MSDLQGKILKILQNPVDSIQGKAWAGSLMLVEQPFGSSCEH